MNIKTKMRSILFIGIGAFGLCGLLFAGIVSNSQAQQNDATKEKNGSVKTCSNATLAGRFAFLGSGAVPGNAPDAPKLPFASLSQMTMDGAGSLTNKITLNRDGQIQPTTGSGTYTVNADCTGTMSFTFAGAPVALNFNLVISEMEGAHGKEFYFISTSLGGVITHTAKRIE